MKGDSLKPGLTFTQGKRVIVFSEDYLRLIWQLRKSARRFMRKK